jgi:hypothetical protein
VATWNKEYRHPTAKERELVSVEILDSTNHIEHVWRKTNLVTVSDSSGMYDAYACENCGVTGRRYGIGGPLRRDKKFKANKYRFCDTSGRYTPPEQETEKEKPMSTPSNDNAKKPKPKGKGKSKGKGGQEQGQEQGQEPR